MKKYFLNGAIYDSKSEAAVGRLLEIYVPEFDCLEGKTLHVSDSGASFDFVLPSAILKWHPQTRNESLEAYIKRKQQQISSSLNYNNRELLVITGVNELYHKVLARFGKDVPAIEIIQGRYGALKAKAKSVTKENLEKLLSSEGKIK